MPTKILPNEYLLHDAYEFAYKNGIKTAIHAGDLIEGDSNPEQRRLYLYYQLEYLKKVYPQDDSIHTYFLYGNHDFNASSCHLSGNEDLFRINIGKPHSSTEVSDAFREIKNLESIGLNRSYVTFPDSFVKISHLNPNGKANRYYSPDYTSSCNLELAGHSHRFSLNSDGTLSVPSTACTKNDVSDVGFVELIEEEKEFVAKRYNKVSKQTGEIVIKKKFVRY